MNDFWEVKPAVAINPQLLKNTSYSKEFLQILANRGVSTSSDLISFLKPEIYFLKSPFHFKNMDLATVRIREAISKKEKIAIFTDSDMDGLTSLSVLCSFFERFNIKPVKIRFPHGHERYGMTAAIAEEILEAKPNLVITLDSGIRDLDAVDCFKKNNVDVIICDHHQPGENLPNAIIVNHKLKDCLSPYKEYAGVGVAFKLTTAVLLSYIPAYNKRSIILQQTENQKYYADLYCRGILLKKIETKELSEINTFINHHEVAAIFWCGVKPEKTFIANNSEIDWFSLRKMVKDFADLQLQDLLKKIEKNERIDETCENLRYILAKLFYLKYEKYADYVNSVVDLVAMGTISDVMPLTGENRILVTKGLKVLPQTKNYGLALFNKRSKRSIDHNYIGWSLAPFLNTPGRYGKTELAANFLLSSDQDDLSNIYEEINTLNENRKKQITECVAKTCKNLTDFENENLIFIESADIPDGLVGLIAGRIADKMGKPTVLISTADIDESNLVKGSGRAPKNIDFFSCIEPFEDKFESLGGHAQAFGFSLDYQLIPEIKKKLNFSMKEIKTSVKKKMVDLQLDVENLTYELIQQVEKMQPYGPVNEEPLFFSSGVQIAEFTSFGKTQNHGKYFIRNNTDLEVIGWGIADKMQEVYEQKKNCDLVYRVQINEFNGYCTPRIIIEDLA